MATYLLACLLALLSLTPQVGLSPLTIRTKVHLHPQFLAGTVCLLMESENESSADCWTVEDPPQRTWTKYHTLRGSGEWRVWVTQEGKDLRGNAMSVRSPEMRIEVY